MFECKTEATKSDSITSVAIMHEEFVAHKVVIMVLSLSYREDGAAKHVYKIWNCGTYALVHKNKKENNLKVSAYVNRFFF